MHGQVEIHTHAQTHTCAHISEVSFVLGILDGLTGIQEQMFIWK